MQANTKKKLLVTVAVVLAVALVAGLTSLALGNLGSESDPLVTLSYLNDVLTKNILAKVDENAEARSSQLKGELEKMINESGADTDSGFVLVTLSSGQTLSCSVGTEMMLRIGTAVSAGADSPRLIDETGGSPVSNAGVELVKNHMYMVTINGNGVKATSSVKILVRGTYTIA